MKRLLGALALMLALPLSLVTFSVMPSVAASKQVPVNLARGKMATAASEERGNVAGRAVDGDPKTRWCASGPQANVWWQVDLGHATTVKAVRSLWESSGGRYRYRIECSPDAKVWQQVVDAAGNDKPGPYEDRFPEVQTRYVRITFLGSSGGWGSIREVEVFGDETIAADPHDEQRRAEAALLGEIKVPAGFEATIFAAPPVGQYPVFVSAAPNGDLYVSQDKNGSLGRKDHFGAVLRLRDTDGDGRADAVKRFVDDVDSPRGLVWDHDRLYLMHPPHLTAYIDRDGDGVADEQQRLVSNIGFDLKARPADHTSNGVTLAIDGWLYLAIGDFGFMEATGADGRKLQLRGGGVVRVRPDGTGLELYSRGTRNILIASFDPLLNAFSRDNTNDGGGWDIRLHHYSGLEHHGYPSLFQNFGDEIVQPLADYGGGSGCGGVFVDEPGFPAGYGHALYTADWGRGQIYRHQLTPHGATFTADQHECFTVPRATDVDVDANSRLYVSSWRNGGFSYSDDNVGFLARIAPQGYRPEPLPDFARLDAAALVEQLRSPSHRRRMEAQRELVRRRLPEPSFGQLVALARDAGVSLATRVAAIFALKQGLGPRSTAVLVPLLADETVREGVVRALGDRLEEVADVPLEPIVAALADSNPRVRLAAVIAVARLGRLAAAAPLAERLGDPDPIVAHTSVRALAVLGAADACFAVIERPTASPAQRAGALRVLQSLHTARSVAGLIDAYEHEPDGQRRRGIVSALCRLYYQEGPWKGESWGTRPDTSGPYYQAATWAETQHIADVLRTAVRRERGDDAAHLFTELNRHKIQLDGSLDTILAAAEKDPAIIPAAVGQLSRLDHVPENAQPLLMRAANLAEADPVVRMQTVMALVKLPAAEAWEGALRALSKLEAGGRNKPEYERARDALLNSSKLELQLPLFTALAGQAASGAIWADAALLQVSTRGSVEARDLAGKTLEAAWQNPARRVQIIAAVEAARHNASKARVLSAEHDEDLKVAAAARHAIKALRWDQPSVKPQGPKIGTLEPAVVVEQVLKTHGSVNYGEELFARLNCARCHTVKTYEPLRGPFLGNIAATYRRRELAESVVMPSKSIAQGFATNQFVLDDGRTLTGFVTLEAADRVVIRDIDGKETAIPADTIETRVKQPISMMPEGLVKELAVNEFASLIDYLESLVKK